MLGLVSVLISYSVEIHAQALLAHLGLGRDTVTQKTIAMFGTFDFHGIFLHNL